jgi:repressor LexA
MNKIQQLRKERRMSQAELARKAGISEISIRKYENGDRKPKIETLQRIANALDVDLDLFLTSSHISFPKNMTNLFISQSFLEKTSELLNAEDNNKKLNNAIRLFCKLNETGQDKAAEHMELLCRISEYQKAPTSAPESKIIVLPYFRAGVSAGSGIFILGNEAEDEIELPDLPEYEAADFAIDINGDSMEPDFSHDDIALVQQDAELFPGDIGVFVVNSNAFIKELGRNELISRNKDYKNIPIHEGDNIVCMGKVIGKVKTDEE